MGGAISDADNANPTFDLEQDFNPDIQNSGPDADGVGLFDVSADSLNGNSVPIDAVLYGGSNGNNLIDESGQAGNVDVGDATATQSIERTADGWRIQEAPTPNDCTPLF